ncbi:nuclear transport factor 2 family protein [Amycolatopsis jejuensis]|uniref:nuclear transport factor 2 family protein n=1 Tax=Amycolatopsis jejuensis TaxID=330084 RepID=UPI0005256CAA|nr:nuclear transport factor 2 family protein [Amycolatopsis jejuensis]
MSNPAERDRQREEIVKRALGGLGHGDVSGMAAAVAEDVEYRLPGSHPLAATHRGKDTFLALVGGLLEQFDGGIHYDFHRFVVSGDTVVATFRGTGKTVQGKDYDNQYCALWDFDDESKVVRVTEFFDSHHVVATLL